MSPHKILVFEFIIGGGLAQQTLPETLAKEGLMMLEALIAELEEVPFIQMTVLLDWRYKEIQLPENIEVVVVSDRHNIYETLADLMHRCDLVFPIAPEMDDTLLKITALAEKHNIKILNSSSEAVAICSDKLVTSRLLQEHAIDTVKTTPFEQFSESLSEQWVIKPRDGVGSLNSYLVSNKKQFEMINNQIKFSAGYIIQPYIEGDILSLSGLFKEGKAWLLCCNRQYVSIHSGRFELDACIVNITYKNQQIYQNLMTQVANAIPGLFGYVGLDIIQPEQGDPLILEINPRLTTSYVGINQAIGFNVVKSVIEMPEIDPIIKKTRNKQITISIIEI